MKSIWHHLKILKTSRFLSFAKCCLPSAPGVVYRFQQELRTPCAWWCGLWRSMVGSKARYWMERSDLKRILRRIPNIFCWKMVLLWDWKLKMEVYRWIVHFWITFRFRIGEWTGILQNTFHYSDSLFYFRHKTFSCLTLTARWSLELMYAHVCRIEAMATWWEVVQCKPFLEKCIIWSYPPEVLLER